MLLASRGLFSAPSSLLLLLPPSGDIIIKGKDVLVGHGARGGTFYLSSRVFCFETVVDGIIIQKYLLALPEGEDTLLFSSYPQHQD